MLKLISTESIHLGKYQKYQALVGNTTGLKLRKLADNLDIHYGWALVAEF